MGRDPEIVVAYHLAFGLEFGSDRSIPLGCLLGQWKGGECVAQLTESLQSRFAVRTFNRSIHKFAVCDDRNGSLAGPEPGETTKYCLRPFLTNIDHDVRVEQVARLHLEAFPLLGNIRCAIRK